jgi:hypothetical protein
MFAINPIKRQHIAPALAFLAVLGMSGLPSHAKASGPSHSGSSGSKKQHSEQTSRPFSNHTSPRRRSGSSSAATRVKHTQSAASGRNVASMSTRSATATSLRGGLPPSPSASSLANGSRSPASDRERDKKASGDRRWRHLHHWWPEAFPVAVPFGVNAGSGSGDNSGSGSSGGDSASAGDGQGSFMVAQQEAFAKREEVRQAMIETRRKRFDEELYEASLTPTAEEERQRAMRQQLLRSLNNPPLPEIHSGVALNHVLDYLKSNPEVQGRDVKLNAAILGRINVTGSQRGSLGLIKENGKLSWPVALQGSVFDDDRNQIDELVRRSVEKLHGNGAVQADTLKPLSTVANRMERKLAKQVKDISPAEYIDGKRFLGHLDDTVQALEQPLASGLKPTAKGDTVAELVKNMSSEGLRFTPATPGDEAAYTALHQALVASCQAPSENRLVTP